METEEIASIDEEVRAEGAFLEPLRAEMGKVIVGQSYLVDRLIIGLLANGHVLLEGVPGLAKTLMVNSLSKIMSLDFSRIQFTPDVAEIEEFPRDLRDAQDSAGSPCNCPPTSSPWNSRVVDDPRKGRVEDPTTLPDPVV